MKDVVAAQRDMVSVILAVRNEAPFVQKTLASLLERESDDFDIEFLVVDGRSDDGSAEIIQEMATRDPRIRCLCNEKTKTPCAFNIGLREARGEYVCILGAHATYARDYVAVCLRELIQHSAAGCSGRVVSRPRNDTLQARLVNWAMASPFGSSGRSFRTQPEGYVDSVAYPLMKKQVLLELGGYDEALHRNQDNDMNERLSAHGYKLYCTWKTHAVYYTPGSLWALAKYAFRNGYWNVLTLRRKPASMKWRHLIPGIFVLALLLVLIAGITAFFVPQPYQTWSVLPLLSLLLAHLCGGLLAALRIAFRERSLAPLGLPLAFLGFHVAYGAGSLWALASNARCKDSSGQ